MTSCICMWEFLSETRTWKKHMAGARLPWEGIVLSNYQPPNRQAQRGRKPLIWVFAYESAKEFPHLLCDSWTGSIWVSCLWRTTEEMWNIVTYVWCCRILSSEHNDHRCLNQKSCDSLQETPRFMPVHIFGRKKNVWWWWGGLSDPLLRF